MSVQFEVFKQMMKTNAEKSVGRPVSDDELDSMVAKASRDFHKMLSK
jgi:hypothetical protein